MGNIPCVTGAPGYGSQPDVVKRKVKAGLNLTKGAVLTMSTSAGDGITVVECGSGNVPCGIALTAISSGDYGYMQTFGLNEVAMTITAADVSEAEVLIAGAANGVCTSLGADGLDTGNGGGRVVGLALAAETSTTMDAETVMLFPVAGY